MTLKAVDTWDVRGASGPAYKVKAYCANPNCRKQAQEGHHIITRGRLKGDYKWVEIEHAVYPNLCWLCIACHRDITGEAGGHKAAIRLVAGTWVWCLLRGGVVGEDARIGPDDYVPIAPLDPHPPTLDQIEQAPASHPISGSELCPTCGQNRRLRVRSEPSSPARRRKTWGVRVPDDGEDGAVVLDTLVDDLALVLGYDGDNARYYVLVPALAFCQMNRAQFSREIEGMAQ